MTMRFSCPVCGYPELHEAPYTENGGGSYEICPSCGFEFGVTDDDEGETYESWRAKWVDAGMHWWSNPAHVPRDWDPRAQLASLESGG